MFTLTLTERMLQVSCIGDQAKGPGRYSTVKCLAPNGMDSTTTLQVLSRLPGHKRLRITLWHSRNQTRNQLGSCPKDVYGADGCTFQNMCVNTAPPSPPPPPSGPIREDDIIWNPYTYRFFLNFQTTFDSTGMEAVQVDCGLGFANAE